MALSEFFYLLRWDFKINHGWRWDSFRARLLLLEVRWEQLVHRNLSHRSFLCGLWYLCRFSGSIYQWLLCNSNIPGTIPIGRGLRLPHPQNIILTGFAEIGEFCTIYHNVSVASNGFIPAKPSSTKIGSRVLLGAGTILVGEICIGSDVLIGERGDEIRPRPLPGHLRPG
jgi:serine O-acetyltransferase